MRTEDQTAQPRTVAAKTALTSAFVLAAALALLTAGLGYLDGTGLFAPENWVDAGPFPGFATSPAWATVIPGAAKPAGSWTGLTGVTITAQPGGGWRLTGTAGGGYALSVK